MNSLFKLPLIGRFLRILNTFVKAPTRFDFLYASTEKQGQQIEQERLTAEALRKQVSELEALTRHQAELLEAYGGHIRMHSRLLDNQRETEQTQSGRIQALEQGNERQRDAERALAERILVLEQGNERQKDAERALAERILVLEQINERQKDAERALAERILVLEQINERQRDAERALAERILALEQGKEHGEQRLEAGEATLKRHEEHLSRMADIAPDYLDLIIGRICSNQERLIDLNWALSAHPTIWGSKDKIKIAESASVYTCFFNTNSGTITVGENTFAGSRVNILAGGHDTHLKGFLRRDAEYVDGCDIKIGNGVWLGSGCTLLGPCVVGDNAVIAGGAVVTPGTVVPDNTIYGGVPAHKISELDDSVAQDENNPYVRKALDRCNGILFVEGWSEKRLCPDLPCVGHWMIRREGLLFADRRKWTLHYALYGVDQCALIIEGNGETQQVTLTAGPGEMPLELAVGEGQIGRFVLRLVNDTAQLFAMLIERKGEE